MPDRSSQTWRPIRELLETPDAQSDPHHRAATLLAYAAISMRVRR